MSGCLPYVFHTSEYIYYPYYLPRLPHPSISYVFMKFTTPTVIHLLSLLHAYTSNFFYPYQTNHPLLPLKSLKTVGVTWKPPQTVCVCPR